MEDSQKRLKRANVLAQVGYVLSAVPIVLKTRMIFEKGINLDVGALIKILLGILLSPFFWAGVTFIVMAIFNFKKLKREKIIEVTPKAPKVVLAIVVLFILLCSGTAAWLIVANRDVNAEKNITIDEKIALTEIITKVVNDPDNYTKADHDLFWKIAQEANISKRERDRIVETSMIGFQNSKLFWEDMLMAIRLGRPYISGERQQLERKLSENDLATEITKLLAENNEKLMREIVLTKKIIVGGKEVEVTEELIREILNDMNAKEKQIKRVLEDLYKK